jgi:DNA (cytosine-5)-methyltransferase 1
MTLTITDLFCGAGGSSSGAIQVPGVRIRMAANHWRLAVETHNTNHPDTDHATVDLHEENPRYFPRTDILWASPECTKWSQAGGSQPKPAIEEGLFEDPLSDDAATRSRLLMFDVLRFAEHHRYRAIVLENVVDIATQPKYRLAWQVWRQQLTAIGYRFIVVSLNSMHAQAFGPAAPQSRDRLYVVAWRRGERVPDLARFQRPRAWCDRCGAVVESAQAFKPGRTVGKYRQQYVYVHGACGTQVEPHVLPAAVAIDWSLRGQQIGHMKIKKFLDKKTGAETEGPLAPKTIARIEAGLRRYARPNPPMVVPAGGTWNDTALSVADPFRTRTTRDTEALVVPVEGRDGLAARQSSDPARTQTTRLQDALVVPLRQNGVARPAATAPVPTVAAAGNHHALVMRNNTARGDQGQMSYPPNEPLRTVLAEQRQSLIRWDHMLYGYDTGELRPVGTPMPTQTTVQGDALLAPEIAVEDCTFRMLEPHEIQAAMAFAADYRVLGNKRERVRQLGNAVTPPAARDLIAAVVEALTGEEVAR